MGAVDNTEWVCVLCGCHIQKDWARRATNFVLSLNIPPWKFFEWFRRPQLWATGDWQLHHDNASTHASRLLRSFLMKHQITHVTLTSCDFWLFPKLKSPLEGKRFQTIDEIQENMMRQLWRLGELYVVPWCLLWKGLRCHCPVCNVSCIFFNKCVYLHGWVLSGQASRKYF